MANLADSVAENAPGDFYVDRTCIDCDTCRQIAPSVFARSEAIGKSFVARQPDEHGARVRAAMALVSCPTSSIGTLDKTDVKEASRSFPDPIDGGISYCGFAAESSYGASSYFVERPGKNLLVDSPRAAHPLLKRLTALGGVAQMILTHRDDVADHAVFRREFGCERVIHKDDAVGDTVSVERIIEGLDPTRLDDDLVVIPVPGHTRGSVVLLYREHFLFTGDHLCWSDEQGQLAAFREVCWYSWAEQTRSMERLLDFRFEWILPGHGRRYHAPSARAMRDEVEALAKRMRATL